MTEAMELELLLLHSLPESGVSGGVAIPELARQGIALGWEDPELEWTWFTEEIGMALEG